MLRFCFKLICIFALLISQVCTFYNIHGRKSYTFKFFSSFGVSPSWYAFDDCLVLFPMNRRVPKSIIHFIGGFVAGSAVNIAYSGLLEHLATKDHLIIATSIAPFDTDHEKLSEQSAKSFWSCYSDKVLPIVGRDLCIDVPVIGLGHSLGGKLLVCMNSRKSRTISPSNKYKPTANVFLAFNNYGAQDSLEMTKEQLSRLSFLIARIILKLILD